MKRLLAAAAIVMGTTTSAWSSCPQRQDPAPTVDDTDEQESESRFQRLDSDKNGELARDELFMIASARFDQLDTDDDGVLSIEEFQLLLAGSSSEPVARFRALDKDGDGRIHRDELPDWLRARFEQFDTNENEYIDEDELQRMAISAREARNGPPGQLRLMRRLMELDLDKDGRLHRDELPEAMESLRRRFDEYDVNGDGYIGGAELRAMTEQSRRPGRYQQY